MIAILHNIRSVHNTASMFRTAEAAGVEKIILTGYSPAPLDRFGRLRPDFAKVSLNAEKYLAWEQSSSLSKVITKLKKLNYKVCAVEQSSGSISCFTAPQINFHQTALIVGNEVRGISKQMLRQCDLILEIPLYGKKESLNVSVAFAIVAFTLRARTNNITKQ